MPVLEEARCLKVNVTDTDHRPKGIIYSSSESFVQYGSSSLGRYQFVNQDILYLLSRILFFITSMKCRM